MRRSARFFISLAVFIYLCSLLPVPECQATEPTLARLSFWVQPERMAEFEAAFDEQMLPILKRQGLIASSKKERPTVEGAFTLCAYIIETTRLSKLKSNREGEGEGTRCLNKEQ